jgi:hypothetical protein
LAGMARSRHRSATSDRDRVGQHVHRGAREGHRREVTKEELAGPRSAPRSRGRPRPRAGRARTAIALARRLSLPVARAAAPLRGPR